MTSRSVNGRVWMRSQFAASGFELSLPVADLIVGKPNAMDVTDVPFLPSPEQRAREAGA